MRKKIWLAMLFLLISITISLALDSKEKIDKIMKELDVSEEDGTTRSEIARDYTKKDLRSKFVFYIKSEKNYYEVCEPIKIKVVWRNISKEDLRINVSKDLGLISPCIRDDKGKFVTWLIPGEGFMDYYKVINIKSQGFYEINYSNPKPQNCIEREGLASIESNRLKKERKKMVEGIIKLQYSFNPGVYSIYVNPLDVLFYAQSVNEVKIKVGEN